MGNNFKKYLLGFFILADLAIASSIYHEMHNGQFTRTLRADGIGYNAYLPAFFIHDGNIKWDYYTQYLQKHRKKDLQDFRKKTENESFVNKYSIGLAITQAPFWLTAYLFQANKSQITGYEPAFMVALFINNLIWLFTGLFLFGKLLLEKGKSVWEIWIYQALLLFATNLFHYITFDLTYTHTVIIGFFFIAIYAIEKWLMQQKIQHYFLFAMSIILVLLLRPIDIIIMPILFIYVFTHPLFQLRFINRKIWIVSFFCGILFATIYFGSLYLQTGNPFTYSYGNELFYFNNPHFFEILFGYRSGWYLYAPVLLLLWIYWFNYPNKRTVFAVLLVFVACVYILSCWSEHWYGCRLGNRPLLDYIPVLSLPILHVFIRLSKVQLKLLALFIIFCLYYNQILHYQYRHYIIDWCNVDKEQFWKIFLKTHK